MFDSNAMRELAYLSADRYQRAGGGGAHKVYNSSKAYHDARGHGQMSPWRRAVYEAGIRWQQSTSMAREQYRLACLTSQDGFYHGDGIPF